MFSFFKKYYVGYSLKHNDERQHQMNRIITRIGIINFILFALLGFSYCFLQTAANQLNKTLLIIYYVVIFFYLCYFENIVFKYRSQQKEFDNAIVYKQVLKQKKISTIIGGLFFFYGYTFIKFFFNTEVATMEEIIITILDYAVMLLSWIIVIYFIIKANLTITISTKVNSSDLAMKDRFLRLIIGYIDETNIYQIQQLYQKLTQLNVIFFYLQLFLLLVCIIVGCINLNINITVSISLFLLICLDLILVIYYSRHRLK